MDVTARMVWKTSLTRDIAMKPLVLFAIVDIALFVITAVPTARRTIRRMFRRIQRDCPPTARKIRIWIG